MIKIILFLSIAFISLPSQAAYSTMGCKVMSGDKFNGQVVKESMFTDDKIVDVMLDNSGKAFRVSINGMDVDSPQLNAGHEARDGDVYFKYDKEHGRFAVISSTKIAFFYDCHKI